MDQSDDYIRNNNFATQQHQQFLNCVTLRPIIFKFGYLHSSLSCPQLFRLHCMYLVATLHLLIGGCYTLSRYTTNDMQSRSLLVSTQRILTLSFCSVTTNTVTSETIKRHYTLEMKCDLRNTIRRMFLTQY